MMQKATCSVTPPCPSGATTTARTDGDTQRDLWRLLDALALCRRQYDLTANSLSVLRALISFLPKATPATGALLVWPSNRALCERADGMDERTLRRHIDRLISAGLIQRRASPNGKRFALRCRKTVVAAFGFDLAPLRDNGPAIAATAQQERTQAEVCRALRAEILSLLYHLSETGAPVPESEEAGIRRMLRRKYDVITLTGTRDALRKSFRQTCTAPREMTVNDSQIDRHIQNTNKESFDSVPLQSHQPERNCDQPTPEKHLIPADDDLTLTECLNATSESRTFTHETVQSWTDVLRLADMLGPMIGIGTELAEHAKRTMGPLKAAVSILCIIQQSTRIHHPAAYLRRLAILAEDGKYSIRAMVRAALRSRFTAANHASA